MSNKDFKVGVSIIVPCARPNEHLGRLLDSIYNQQGLDLNFVEVILVFNGYNEFIIERFADKLKKLKSKQEVRLLYSSVGSASKARNMGLEASTREFICFCDDDDWLGVNYINELYKVIDLSYIAFAPIIDVNVNGKKESREDINRFLKSNNPNDLPLYSGALTLNACKMIPAIYAKQVHFDESLTSGEDIVYFCEYVNKFRPSFTHADNDGCYYYRLRTEDSKSRQSMSYEFNVEQRLDVIKKLVDLKTTDLNDFFQSKINAQLSFLNKYFTQNLCSLSSIQKSFEIRDLSNLMILKNDRFYINLS